MCKTHPEGLENLWEFENSEKNLKHLARWGYYVRKMPEEQI